LNCFPLGPIAVNHEYAEAGDFERAIIWATKALELAPVESKNEIRAHLDLFGKNKAFYQEIIG